MADQASFTITESLEQRNAIAASSDVAESLARATALYRAQDFPAAAALAQALLVQAPETAPALQLLGLCRLRTGALAEALPLLARAATLAPEDAEARLHYGMGLLAAGRVAEAVPLLRTCIAVLPTDPAPPLNLASALLVQGDAVGALVAARKARLRAPALAETQYVLGLAELACGHLPRAAEAFRRAVKLAPGFAEAWVNLGVVRYRQADIDAAREAMERALAVSPGHPTATANLAVFLRLTGDGERSEALLREAIVAGGSPEARVNLASALLGAERTAEALALLDGPPPAEPRHALHWRLQKSIALLDLGRAHDAQAELVGLEGRLPEHLAPLLAWRELLLALGARDPEGAREAAGRMEAGLRANAEMLPEHRIIGFFDLARFWRSQGDTSRAFALWAEGHRALRPFQPFSREPVEQFFAALTTAFDRTRLHEGPRASNRDAAPVFVVGMPRSGTTLAEQILAAHRQVHGAGERKDLHICFNRLGQGGESRAAAGRIAALSTVALDRAAEPYLAELHALAPEAVRVVDKMPGNFRLLGFAALLLPGARVIHCERDPRDIGLSIFTHRFYGYHPYAHDIADLGWYLGQYRRLMQHWLAVLPNPTLRLRLADWVEDFSGTLRRVLDFLELEHDPACERFYQLKREVRTVSRAQVRQPINAAGIGRWRHFARELAPLIEELHRAGWDPDAGL